LAAASESSTGAPAGIGEQIVTAPGPRGPAQVDPRLLGYPEQVAEDRRRQRHGVRPDEVGRAVRHDRIEQPVGDPLYAGRSAATRRDVNA
jgi:hypothetical protein